MKKLIIFLLVSVIVFPIFWLIVQYISNIVCPATLVGDVFDSTPRFTNRNCLNGTVYRFDDLGGTLFNLTVIGIPFILTLLTSLFLTKYTNKKISKKTSTKTY